MSKSRILTEVSEPDGQRAAEPSEAAAVRVLHLTSPSSPSRTDGRERRRRPRFKLAYPVRVHRDGDPWGIETLTEDINCDGFFCRSDQVFALHERLNCEVLIPAGESQSAAGGRLVLSCRVEVVRFVAGAAQGKSGAAYRVHDYSINVRLDGRT